MHELYDHAKRLLAASKIPTPTEYLDIIRPAFFARLSLGNCPVGTIYKEFIVIAALLYRREKFDHITPPPTFADLIGEARYRALIKKEIQRLERVEELIAAFTGEMVELFCNFTSGLPLIAIQTAAPKEETPTTIPLIDVIDVRDTIATLMRPFYNRADIFASIQEVLLVNHMQASGVLDFSNYKPGKLISPHDFKGTHEEAVHAYLKNTPFDDIFALQIPFTVPQETRFSGQWIIAPPGRGKTTLLHSMFLEDLERDASIIVMDSKGDLINPIKSMAAIADRLVLIEPDARHPLALNPLDVASENVPHTIALIEYILSGLLDAKFTNLQSALFRHVLPAIMQAIPHPTIEDLKRVLAEGLPSTNKLDERLQKFFSDKNSGFHSKTYAETRSQIIWRLDLILTNDTMRAMFASPNTRLKIADAMNSGKIILIDASKAVLGDEGSEFYQRFFLALILAAAQQRAKLKPDEKMPVYCYLDECQWVRNDQKLATILDECRSQKIGLILAHQRTEQITDKNVLSAMSNCAIRFANSDDEAKYLAPKLRCEPELLYSLPKGTFAAFVRDLTPHAVALKVPYTNLETLPRMTSRQQEIIRQRMRAEYGFVPQPSSEPSIFARATQPPSPTQTSSQTHSSPEKPQPESDISESGSTW